MTYIRSVTLEAADPIAAERFCAAAFGLGDLVRTRAPDQPTSGFRAFTMALTVAQPSTVNDLTKAALEGGANTLKPPAKSFWGYGAAVRAPDGAVWTIASSSKKDTGPATREIEDVVLLLGCSDVAETKRFYVDHGLTVARSFGRKYVEFEPGQGRIKLALYGRRQLAKHAGVASPEGSGSHRIVIGTDSGSFTDPDGFVWETVSEDASL